MGPEQLSRSDAMEVALDVAITVLNSGGSTRMADKTFHNIVSGCGYEELSAIWRLDVATASDGGSLTVARPIGAIGVNLQRVSEAALLSDRASRGEISVSTLKSELERIRALPHPYTMLTTLAVLTAATAGFVRLADGDWSAAACASVAALAGYLVRFLLTYRNVPGVGPNLAAAIVSASLAGLALRLGLTGTAASTVIGSIIYLAPGLPLVNGFVDIISERYLVIGLERVASAALQAVLLAVALQFSAVIAI